MSHRNGWVESLGFLAQFVRRPSTVGAVIPSSRWLARAMVEWGALHEADLVVELGPGTGPFTQAILDTDGDQTQFFALELNTRFAERLGERFPKANVYNDSAERILHYMQQHNRPHVDNVLCGLPWASLPLKVQEGVMSAISQALAPGGTFATFAYLHALGLPNARRFRQRLESTFSSVETSRVVWQNVPPAFVYRCRR